MNEKYIKIEVTRGDNTQEINFPEEYSDLNRVRWLVARLIAPVKVRWFE